MKTTTYFRFSSKAVFGVSLLLILPKLLLAQLNVSITPTQITCFGAANGQAHAAPTGGTAPYTYAWSNNSTTQTIQNLTPGNYSVTVHDANQNLATAGTSISQPTQLGAVLTGQSQICASAPDGWATAVSYGGTPPYSYLWNTGATTAQIVDLVGGNYQATVTDSYGCTVTGSFSVGFWNEGIWTMTSVTPASCAYANGEASITPGSGTVPYQYLWNTGATTASIDNLESGSYSVTVSDAHGCSADQTVLVPSDSPLSAVVLLSTPYCLNAIASFSPGPPPPIYPQIHWTLADTLDHIISGQGTDSIQVQWTSVGFKSVEFRYGANGIFCGLLSYALNVVICADTHEAILDHATITPNPFSDFLQITLPDGIQGETEAVITDLSGRPLRRQSIPDATATVQTEDLPAGFYFLKIKSGNTEKVWKLAKQ